MQEFLEGLGTACVPLALAVIGYISAFLAKFINAKKEEIQSKTNNEKVNTYIGIAADTALRVVETLNATLVEELKAANEDGKLTQEEILEIRNTALSTITETLSEDVKNGLTTAFGDLEKYLSMLIESSLYELKLKLNTTNG